MKIKIGGKQYPYLINTNVYSRIEQETGRNPFGVGEDKMKLNSPDNILIMLYHAVNEASSEEVSKDELGKMSSGQMFDVIDIFQDDMSEAMGYLNDKLPKNGQAPKETGRKVGEDISN